jgi:hypothetical protein
LLARNQHDGGAWGEHSQAYAMVLLELHAFGQEGETEHCLHRILDFATAAENWNGDGSYLNCSTLTGDYGEDHFRFLKTQALWET